MAKTGSKPEDEALTLAAYHAEMIGGARFDRDNSRKGKFYVKTVELLTADVLAAIDKAVENPEFGIKMSEICTQFALTSMSDPTQDPGRATSLSQGQTLMDMLAKVRNTPDVYRKEIQSRFGSKLDPRQYPTSKDAFQSTINSQTDRVSKEARGWNIPAERIFGRKRVELLRAIEKGYNRLRYQALGIEPKPKKGHGR